MKLFLLTIVTLFSLQTMAVECTVMLISDTDFVEKTFEAPSASQGHNVPEMTLVGKTDEVTAMADGKWLGMSWRRNGELIAESINLIRDVVTQPRVLIMYNPKNTEEQVSLNCD